jgi:hypothetical protein
MSVAQPAFRTWMAGLVHHPPGVLPHSELDMNFPHFLTQFAASAADEKLALLAKAPPMGLLVFMKEKAPRRNAAVTLSIS